MRKLLLFPAAFLYLTKEANAQQLLSTSDYLAIIFMVLGSVITTGIIFMIIHHYVKSREKIASDPRVAMLSKHMRLYLEKGFTKKQIIDAAVNQGWPPVIVESAMKNI